MSKIIGFVIYNLIAKHMPMSYSKFNFGSKYIRRFCSKLLLAKSGKNINIEKGASFSSRLEIGNNSGIGYRASIGGKVIIGDDVMMGPDCVIYTQNHEFERLDIPMNQQGVQDEKPVIIGNDVWIGGQVTILPGMKIGNSSIIGARAVVVKDIPDFAIVGGNPAKILKFRNTESVIHDKVN
ncbi:transferase [Alkalibacterium sp. 20]|uniref:acyltransferase n=1 Tax=Alkalibacterium sp. 20 TaxID=1798803 RepID=UPI0009004FAC|nr:transferase [Alkalibacterium sp. 20]OJF90443.1 transferase [Alkalibacterium sp. 20]